MKRTKRTQTGLPRNLPPPTHTKQNNDPNLHQSCKKKRARARLRSKCVCVDIPGLSNGVQLVEEQHARSSATSLVKHITDVGLRLAEPHGKELRALDGNEVGLALVRDSLGQQGLSTTGRAIEQNTL